MGFRACLRKYFPRRIVEVHFTTGKPAIQTQDLPLLIQLVMRAAITSLVGQFACQGLPHRKLHHQCNMEAIYPIAICLTRFRGRNRIRSIAAQQLEAPAPGYHPEYQN